MLATVLRRPWLTAVGGVGILLLATLAWLLVSPLFITTTLVEAPGARSAAPLARGTFNEIDAIHKGRGDAIMSRTADGRLLVNFEEFSVTNGPDLHVYLSRNARPTSDSEVKDGVLLGKLKASEGTFSYETDAPLDPAQFKSVVIHCVTFRTIFSFAVLS